jgi:hypothetical protein
MVDQQAAIETPQEHRAFATIAVAAAWRFRFPLICIAGGVLSVILGADNYWDFRYYHLYAPWAYLHDRYLYDLGPAQAQGFLIPVADLLLYGLISSPLNEAPRAIAFIMGAVHGVNAALLLAIVCHVIRPSDATGRFMLRVVAWLMGVTGGGFVPLIGTSSNDLTSSLFVLAALLALLKAATPPPGRVATAAFATAGVSAGLGIALKYTSAIFAPGLGLVALVAAVRQRTIVGLVVFGAAAAAGFLAVAAHHMLTLWRDFGNPVFPYMNQIFHSPYFEPTAIRDARFLPQGLLELLTFPFSWTTVDTYIVAEQAFRDWRGAIAYVAMWAGAAAFAVHTLRRSDQRREGAPTCDLRLVFVFEIASYFAWALGFANYRYAIPLEMLTGVLTVGSVMWVLRGPRTRTAAAMAVLAVAAVTTVYPNWGRRPYGEKYVDVRVPPLPVDGAVLIATWDPAAFFIPFAEPKAQYVGIENNLFTLSQNNWLATKVKRVMRTPGRPKFLVSVDGAMASGKLDGLLDQLGLRPVGAPCEPIVSNLPGHDLSLCRVVER